VESGIMYLPVYPSDAKTKFNERFFYSSENMLTEILPEVAEFADIIRLIDVARGSTGLYAHILADPSVRKAVCFLDISCK